MDSGNIADGSGTKKLDTILPFMAKAGYSAIGVGLNDVHLGTEFYSRAASAKLAVVDTSPAAYKSTVPYVLKEVGGVKVGIMAFNAPDPKAAVDDMELRKMRFIVLRELRAKCDVLILLDQACVATREWLERNGARMGAPDIVVRGMGQSYPDGKDVVAGTHIMPPLVQGRQMGVVDLEVVRGQQPNVTFNKVELDAKFQDDPEVATAVRVANAVWANSPTQSSFSPPAGAVHYSVMLCKACHQSQYEQWTKTRHAVAIKTLTEKQNNTPDCLPCHSEDFRVKKTYVVDNSEFAGVDCQTCHKNALPHGMERRNYQAKTSVDKKLCLECHTTEHSPQYNEQTYFPKVLHATVSPSTAAAGTTSSH